MLRGGYLCNVLQGNICRQAIKRTVAALKPYRKAFDSLAFRGMSGAIVGPAIAYLLNKHMILIRKQTEICHSSHKVEGWVGTKSYIIVDDFVDTGKTLVEIRKQVEDWQRYEGFDIANCMGVALYNESSLSDHKNEFMRSKFGDDFLILRTKL